MKKVMEYLNDLQRNIECPGHVCLSKRKEVFHEA